MQVETYLWEVLLCIPPEEEKGVLLKLKDPLGDVFQPCECTIPLEIHMGIFATGFPEDALGLEHLSKTHFS